MPGSIWRRRRKSDIPSSPLVAPGVKFMSCRTTSMSPLATARTASSALDATSASMPWMSSSSISARATAGWSSTMRTVPAGARCVRCVLTIGTAVTLHRPRGNDRRHRGGARGRRQGRENPRQPEQDHAGDDEAPVELVALRLRHEQEVQPVGHGDAEQEAGVRDDPIFEKKIPQDGRLRRAEGAARADLLAALRDGERGHADDAEAGDDDEQDDHRGHRADDDARLGEVLILDLVDRLELEGASVVDLQQALFDLRNDLLHLSRRHVHEVTRAAVRGDAVGEVRVFVDRKAVRVVELVEDADDRVDAVVGLDELLPDGALSLEHELLERARDDHRALSRVR